MKHEWRKAEKSIYQPKTEPELVDVPEFKYIVINGEGNPKSPHFSHCIQALYSLAYGIKIGMKKIPNPPESYSDWTVYPLSGIWGLTEEGQNRYDGTLNKDHLAFDLMIRQPDFITAKFMNEMLALTQKKKPNELLSKIELRRITDGKCIQMMHVGSFDDEPQSFAKIQAFAKEMNLKRSSRTHREIYLSDFRKVPTEKLKTILRFTVEG